MPRFRPRTEAELERLDDDALVAYLRAAQAAAHPSAGAALAILVYGHWPNVQRRVALKVPAQWVEDLTDEIVVSAIQSAFDGSSTAEFVVWLQTITARRIADFHRRPASQLRTVPLEPDDSERRGVELATPSHEGALEVQDAVARVLARLQPEHRLVIELIVFDDLSAAEAARRVPGMTDNNAHQIVSRFRRALRRELGGDT